MPDLIMPSCVEGSLGCFAARVRRLDETRRLNLRQLRDGKGQPQPEAVRVGVGFVDYGCHSAETCSADEKAQNSSQSAEAAADAAPEEVNA